MYSLVKFHNNQHSVVLSKNVHSVSKTSECIVKCNGGHYSAFYISKNDDKSYLSGLKVKGEEKISSSTLLPVKSKSSKNKRLSPDLFLSKINNKLRLRSYANTNYESNSTSPKSPPKPQCETESTSEISPSKMQLDTKCNKQHLGSAMSKEHLISPPEGEEPKILSSPIRHQLSEALSKNDFLDSANCFAFENNKGLHIQPVEAISSLTVHNEMTAISKVKDSADNDLFKINGNVDFKKVDDMQTRELEESLSEVFLNSPSTRSDNNIEITSSYVWSGNQEAHFLYSAEHNANVLNFNRIENAVDNTSTQILYIPKKNSSSTPLPVQSQSIKNIQLSRDLFLSKLNNKLSPTSSTTTKYEINSTSPKNNGDDDVSKIEGSVDYTNVDDMQTSELEKNLSEIFLHSPTISGNNIDITSSYVGSVNQEDPFLYSAENNRTNVVNLNGIPQNGVNKSSIQIIYIPNTSTEINSITGEETVVDFSSIEVIDNSGAESISNPLLEISNDNGNIVTEISRADIENSTDHIEFRIPCRANHNSTTYIENNSITETDNTIDVSSIEISEISVSEYIPNSTIEPSKEDTNISTDISVSKNETFIEVIETPVNVGSLNVPYSNNKSKKHFCLYCKTLQCKISRHLLSMHKHEKMVKMALGLPKKSCDRLKIINELRKKGDFLHNTSEDLNSGILIVSRQQLSKSNNKPDDYICCKSCKGFFSKNTLRIHLKKCGGKKNQRSNFSDGRKLTQYLHAAANATLKTKIFPVLRNDDVTKAIRYDELIIKYGNKLSEKYDLTHQHDMIRSHLRLLGRFKIELSKIDPRIKELKEIFKPTLFDNCVTALRTVSHWDSISGFATPAVASSLSTLIKKCAKKQRIEFIKSQCEDLKSELEDFLLLWEEEIPVLINKKALEDQINQKRLKKIPLPSQEDIQKLYQFLKIKMLNSMESLEQDFSNTAWNELVQTTLISIQIFNRRRAGEIERLTVGNYLNKEIITNNIEKDLLQNLSPESMALAKRFVRITLRGKLGRTVSVLLSPICIKAIDIILKFRTSAGIMKQNEYIFSKPGTSKLSKQYYRACPLLRRFADECGAEIPNSLRGTILRKHIATYTSLLNVEDATVDQLANFMGHHKDIHKNIYRVSIPVTEVTEVSKILLGALGGDGEDDEEIGDDEEYNCMEEHEGNNNRIDDNGQEGEDSDEEYTEVTSKNSSLSSKRKRSTSPFGKTKRCRWTLEERQAINEMFGNIKELQKLPSLKMCQAAINRYSTLSKRTPQQLKTWIDNQRRYK